MFIDPHSPEAEAEAGRRYPMIESERDAMRRIFDAEPDRHEYTPHPDVVLCVECKLPCITNVYDDYICNNVECISYGC